MKVKVKNLGLLKQAELEIADFTIICGTNNTGKTYVTYSIYCFMDYVRESYQITSSEESMNMVEDLINKGFLSIDLSYYEKNFKEYLSQASLKFTKFLPKVFAGRESLFQKSSFELFLHSVVDYKKTKINMNLSSSKNNILNITKEESSDQLILSSIVDKDDIDNMPPRILIARMISDAIRNAIFDSVIPRPFISSVERTGAAIFQKELDFTRNRLLEVISEGFKNKKNSNKKGSNAKTVDEGFLLFSKNFQSEYPIPVKEDVSFIRNIDSVYKHESFVLKEHPEIISSFEDIIDGKYLVDDFGNIFYVPNENKRLKLTLVESSSSIRAMVGIGFYLKHIAKKGELLFVDEPELNLHPKNQRKIARLFSRLVNIGIRVFITTHSDYIIKELNTLIMLNNEKEYIKEIAKKNGYKKEELISSDKFKAYIAKNELTKLDGESRRKRCHTLTPADIDPFEGIRIETFDEYINEMNSIQDDILYGGY